MCSCRISVRVSVSVSKSVSKSVNDNAGLCKCEWMSEWALIPSIPFHSVSWPCMAGTDNLYRVGSNK